MNAFTRNVSDIDMADREALEHVLGISLGENQQVIINVVNVDKPKDWANTAANPESSLPEWCNVYAGLCDEEIDRLDNATKQRLDLTRPKS